MRDACNDLADVTIGIEGREESLEARSSLKERPREKLVFVNERYMVTIELGPKLSALRRVVGLCKELNEPAAVTIGDKAKSETFQATLDKRCPYEEGE